jgi:hypothetical protein
MGYLVSADGGNSGVKIIVNGEEFLLFPNINANIGKTVDYRTSSNLAVSTPKLLGRNCLDVKVTPHFDNGKNDTTNFLFGAMAEKYPSDKANRENTDKSNDPLLLNNILTSIAVSVLGYAIKNEKDFKVKPELTFHVTLATGLPYAEWADEAKEIAFNKALQGNHRIEFNNPYFTEDLGVKVIELVINEVMVSSEGDAALEAVRRSIEVDLEKIDPSDLLGQAFVLIDIGAFTTELIGAVFAQISDDDDELVVGLETQQNYCTAIPKGIGNVFADAIPLIEKNPKIKDKITRRDIEIAYTGPTSKLPDKYGYISGKGIMVNEYVYPLAEEFGADIGRKFYGFYNQSGIKSNIKKIYISGGGSKFVKLVDRLKEVLVKDGYTSEAIITVSNPDPVFANAYGYYLYMVDELAERAKSEE